MYRSTNRAWIKIFLSLLCAALLFACTGGVNKAKQETPDKNGPTLPEWVSSPPRQQNVVYGVGSAKIYANNTSGALQNAREIARVELIKKLRVKVSGETTARFSRTMEDERVSELTRSVVNKARSEVEEVDISGITFPRTKVMQDQGQVYVLARLNTAKAAASVEQRIQRVDDRLDGFSTAKQGAGNKLQKIRELLPVLSLLEKRGKLVEKLRLLRPDSSEPEMLDRHLELKDRLLSLLESITIGLKPVGDRAEDLNSVLLQSLLQKGVNARNGENADLIMEYRTDLRNVQRDGTNFVFAKGFVSLLNRDMDVIAQFNARVKGASVEKGLARDRALSKLAEKLGENIAKNLLQKL